MAEITVNPDIPKSSLPLITVLRDALNIMQLEGPMFLRPQCIGIRKVSHRLMYFLVQCIDQEQINSIAPLVRHCARLIETISFLAVEGNCPYLDWYTAENTENFDQFVETAIFNSYRLNTVNEQENSWFCASQFKIPCQC